MKTLKFFLSCLSMLALAVSFSACSDNNDPADPVEVPTPVVTLSAGEAAETSLSFTLTSDKAKEVAWVCVAKGTSVTAEQVLSEGKQVEANKTLQLKAENLTSNTEYEIYAAAKNGTKQTLSAKLEMKTLEAATPTEGPSVTLEFVGATQTSITYSVASQNAEQVIVLLAVAGIEPTEEEILTNGQQVEPNTEAEFTVENLTPNTEYEIFALAIAGEQADAESLVVKTLEGEQGGEEEPVDLATPVYASMTLVEGEQADKYTFMVADEAGTMTLQFDLYTACGLNGAIPEGNYMLGAAEAGYISKESFYLFLSGTKEPIVEAGIAMRLYESDETQSGWKIRLVGAFKNEAGTNYLLEYDGLIDRFGIKSNEEGDSQTVTISEAWFSRPTEDDGVTPVAGKFNLFFRYMDETNNQVLVTLCFNGQDKTYLAGDYYAVGASSSVAGPTGAWVDSELSSVEAGVPPIPEQLEAGNGSDYYARVETLLDLSPMDPNFSDYYSIEFVIKTKGLYSTPREIHATYQGPLGFIDNEDEEENYDLYYNYLETEVLDNSMNLTFTTTASAAAKFSLNIATTSLPKTEGGSWTWYDINSGSIVDPYLGQGTVAENTGKLGVIYMGMYHDTFDDKYYPEYKFTTQGIQINLAGEEYSSNTEWRANCISATGGNDEPEGPQEVDLIFTSGKAETSEDGTLTTVDLTDADGNAAHLVFRLPAAYANYFEHLYGSGTMYLLATSEAGGMEGIWTDANESTITYGGKSYKLPAADLNNGLYYGFNITAGMPYQDMNIIQLIQPVTCEDGLTINSLTFSGALYEGSGEVVEKPHQDWSKVASGYRSMYIESNGTSHKVRLHSNTNGDMVFFIEGVESIFNTELHVGKEITKESYLYQPAVEFDESGITSPIYSGYIMFSPSSTDATKVTVYTGYEDDTQGDTRLKFESPTNIIWFDSGDKGWTATIKEE